MRCAAQAPSHLSSSACSAPTSTATCPPPERRRYRAGWCRPVGDSLRVGVMGAGLIAGCHVRAYAQTPGVDVVAIADPRVPKAEQLAASAGATACTDLDEVLALDPDIVSVCTPPGSHADLTVRALEADRHVLCEKPVALTLRDAERIRHAAEGSARVAMIAHVSRFEPDHCSAKGLVDAGAIG